MFARSVFAKWPQRLGPRARTILTQTQHTQLVDTIRDLPIRVQPPSQCNINAVNFLQNAFPNRRIRSIPFTNDLAQIHALLDQHHMLVFMAEGIQQQTSPLTSASAYDRGMHAVVIVDRVMQNGQLHLLIFDGDDTVANAPLARLRDFAHAQNRSVCDLTSDEIRQLGAEAGLFRLVPAESFLQGARQSFATIDFASGAPYQFPLPHYVPGDIRIPLTWGALGRAVSTVLFGPPAPPAPAQTTPSTITPDGAGPAWDKSARPLRHADQTAWTVRAKHRSPDDGLSVTTQKSSGRFCRAR